MPKKVNPKSLKNLLDRSAPDAPGETAAATIRIGVNDLAWLKAQPEGMSYHIRQAVRQYREGFSQQQQSDDSTPVPEAADEPSPATKRRSGHPKQKQPTLPLGQRIRVHTLTAGGAIYDQDGTVKGYTDVGELLVRLDTQGYASPLSDDWSFDVLPGEPVSHWQVWMVSESGERLLKDNFETPLPAEYFAKEQDKAYHREASRHDDYVPPPRFEVRAVPMEVEATPAPKRRSRTKPKTAQKKAQFSVGSRIKVPSGWTGYVTGFKGDRVLVTVGDGLEDDYPPHLLELV